MADHLTQAIQVHLAIQVVLQGRKALELAHPVRACRLMGNQGHGLGLL
jgi:hypothetical protein